MNIVAISGKKQSGKNCSFNCLLGLKMLELGVIQGEIALDPNDGRLWVSDIFGDEDVQGTFNYEENCRNPSTASFVDEHIHPFIKMYSFAELLKGVCIDLLKLTPEQMFGTNEQKNSPTKYRWEDMPGVITDYELWSIITNGKWKNKPVLHYHKPGVMTGRDIMQFIGTEMFRKISTNVWSDATVNKIVSENSELAIITDCRFPNEVEAVQKAGGKVIRLTRDVLEDNHDSECALDKDKFDWDKFDAIIENDDYSISATNIAVHRQLSDWGYIERVGDEKSLVNDSTLSEK